MSEHVDIHAPAAHRGLTQWDTATRGLAAVWKDGTARIKRLTEAAPWGGDSAGAAFLAAYQKDGGTERMIREGDKVIKGVDDLGAKVRLAVTRTRGTDAGQARTIQSI
ncbi:hypothetical protein Skr01_04570 [Sphaerisporangium krabiense]|uniref:Uncharacterized protein n=1 Tax=Sphaerisporangium krabiense TaxID=763782 RepID=A0A7W8Z7B9_9ACTN|nr:hypothetical protein [Sphaerisporangium krabiense]MBB5628786.1 hypothetical protein [Sphaerisporangium krabiense]GII60372.1 hypothetical protein Skr01_04570 [Sphaerisporangium krabiense]